MTQNKFCRYFSSLVLSFLMLGVMVSPFQADAQQVAIGKRFYGAVHLSSPQTEYRLSFHKTRPVIPLIFKFSLLPGEDPKSVVTVQERISLTATGKYGEQTCEQVFFLSSPIHFKGQKKMTFDRASDFLISCAARSMKGDVLTLQLTVSYGEFQAYSAISNPLEISITIPEG